MGLFENFPYVNFHKINLDWILQKLKTLESTIAALVVRMTAAEEDIDALEGRMDAAEDDIDALDTRMGTAEDDIDALEGRMDAAEDDIDALDTRMGTAEDDIDALETRMSTAEDNIEGAESGIQTLFDNTLPRVFEIFDTAHSTNFLGVSVEAYGACHCIQFCGVLDINQTNQSCKLYFKPEYAPVILRNAETLGANAANMQFIAARVSDGVMFSCGCAYDSTLEQFYINMPVMSGSAVYINGVYYSDYNAEPPIEPD